MYYFKKTRYPESFLILSHYKLSKIWKGKYRGNVLSAILENSSIHMTIWSLGIFILFSMSERKPWQKRNCITYFFFWIIALALIQLAIFFLNWIAVCILVKDAFLLIDFLLWCSFNFKQKCCVLAEINC